MLDIVFLLAGIGFFGVLHLYAIFANFAEAVAEALAKHRPIPCAARAPKRWPSACARQEPHRLRDRAGQHARRRRPRAGRGRRHHRSGAGRSCDHLGLGPRPLCQPRGRAVQAPRVAEARGLPVEKVVEQVTSHVEGRKLGLFGEPHVNVLEFNLALDTLPRRDAAGSGR